MDQDERIIPMVSESLNQEGEDKETEFKLAVAAISFMFFAAGVVTLTVLCLFWGWLENLGIFLYRPHKAPIILMVAIIVYLVIGYRDEKKRRQELRLANKELESRGMEPLAEEE